MSLTLLLDLDNTLLGNNMDVFLPRYLQGLSRRLAAFVEPGLMVKTLLAATHQMAQNSCFERTLAEVFDAAFYPALGVAKAQMIEAIDAFYAEDFPGLRSLTQPRPAAVEVVRTAFERGYRVVIATNPLFPQTAIEQRLAWAGLPVEQFPFRIVSNYETFHFSKPSPAFFSELLARLGWPEGPVVMVGDDWQNDILPSQQAGLTPFWITDPNMPPSDRSAPPQAGQLVDLLPWLDATPEKALLPDFSQAPAILATLRSTPAALLALSRDLPAEAWLRRPDLQTGSQSGSQTWSLTEIVCHLRDAEAEVNLPRVRVVCKQDNPFISARNTDLWAEERQYNRQDGPAALQAFLRSRAELLAVLDGLALEDWRRPARHAIFGPTDLRELTSFLAGHDRMHVRKAFSILE